MLLLWLQKNEPKKRKEDKKILEIRDEDLIALKEKGMSYREISQYYDNNISWQNVRNKVQRYYSNIGKEAPKMKENNITDNELIELREQGLTYKKISEVLEQRGIEISTLNVGAKIRRYYASKGKAVPKILNQELVEDSSDENQKKTEPKSEKVENKLKNKTDKSEYNKSNLLIGNMFLMEIFTKGFSIKEYCAKNNYNEKIIREGLKRIRVIAEHVRKDGDLWIKDTDFLEVISILEDTECLNPSNRYTVEIKKHIPIGICNNGKIDILRYQVFKGNSDLATFILNGMNMKFRREYDTNVIKVLRQQYTNKVRIYFDRLHAIEQKPADGEKVVKRQNQGEER